MGEVGQVTQVINDEVVVRLLREEACAKCGACTAGLDSKDMFIHATNLCEASQNDWVEITLEEENFIKAVMIMYGMPLIGLLAGIGIGFLLTTLVMGSMNELITIAFGLGFSGLVFLWIRKNEYRFNTKQYKPRAIRLASAKECQL